MNQPVKPVLASDSPPIALRTEQPADEALLLELYASTRQEELDLTSWDAATRAAFVQSQFMAMRQGYAGMFPDGQFSIVLLANRAIGRIVVVHSKHEIRLVDMALLPAVRCRGIGSGLIQTVQAEARQAGKPVSLHVLKHNRAARLYERLGFRFIGGDGLYNEMAWQPGLEPPGKPG